MNRRSSVPTGTVAAGPVRLRARLDTPLSRWLWLVKWLLVLPHAVVLALLWIAFGVLSVVAFFAILIAGRYPYAIFTGLTAPGLRGALDRARCRRGRHPARGRAPGRARHRSAARAPVPA